jgi:hypothetical protein
MDLESINRIEIGDVLERVPHHFHGQYIPAIHTAAVDKFSLDGVWVKSFPDEKVFHVSLLALKAGWWRSKQEQTK